MNVNRVSSWSMGLIAATLEVWVFGLLHGACWFFYCWEVGQCCCIYFKKAESQENIIERKFLCWHIMILTGMVTNELQLPFI